MALSLIAAEALVCTYLHGRTLPEDLYSVLIDKVKARLIEGKAPVLDRATCIAIDNGTLTAVRESFVDA